MLQSYISEVRTTAAWFVFMLRSRRAGIRLYGFHYLSVQVGGLHHKAAV